MVDKYLSNSSELLPVLKIPPHENARQYILLRKDLQMSPGKACAQSSHASLSSYLDSLKYPASNCESWLSNGQTKIVLGVSNVEILLNYYKKMIEEKIPHFLVVDEGRTEFEYKSTTTALGIGPWDSITLYNILKDLQLY